MKNGANGQGSSNNDIFWTPKEAAAYMRVNLLTFYEYARRPISKGGPPVRRFGRNCIRIPKEKFIKWANAGTGD